MQAPEIQALGDILQALLGNAGKMSEAQKYNTQMQYEGAREERRQQFEMDMMGEEQKFKKESPEWKLAQEQLEEVTIPEAVKKVLNITDRNTVPRYELENLMNLYYAEESNRLRGEEITQRGKLTPGEQQETDMMAQLGDVLKYWGDYPKNVIDPQSEYNLMELGESGGVRFTEELDKYYDPLTMDTFLDDYQEKYGDIESRFFPGIGSALKEKFSGQRDKKMQTLFGALWQEWQRERPEGELKSTDVSDLLTLSGYGDLSGYVQDLISPGTPLEELNVGLAPKTEGAPSNKINHKDHLIISDYLRRYRYDH